MNAFHFSRFSAIGAVVGLISCVGAGQVNSGQQTRIDDDDFQVLTRGPVHEAFAETITYDPDPGVVITRAPPELIEELPPDQRPAGANVDWIPGYWGWDDERDNFIWISGVWRALPPGREWVPGYWGQANRGYQWVAGYWADAEADEIEYLPEPPAYIESRPNIPAPSPDSIWTPGAWVWHQERYAWRPGIWIVAQPDWDWIPAHYAWAPRGYVFVEGYWDYSIERRGVLFAPVYFETVISRPRVVSFTPVVVINTSVFSDHLFVRPQYSHYYFGDYYAPRYREAGFSASFSYHSSSGRGYDPIYARQRWQHRSEPEWDRRVQANFNLRVDNEDARPRRTLAAQVRYTDSDERRGDRGHSIASRLADVSRDGRSGVRFRQVDQGERQEVSQRGKFMQRFREERRRVETDAAVDNAPTRSEPVRMKARRSPIAAKPAKQLSPDDSPPKRPERAAPDPKVERRERKFREKRDRDDKP